jgi:hypothetical protein
MNKNKNLEEEDRKLRYLRLVVDITEAQLKSGQLSIFDSLQLMKSTKDFALHLFPDKEETYNLIYQNRFNRILKERLESN